MGEWLSKCCQVPVQEFDTSDYDKEESPNGSTYYFMCSKCQNPCDAEIK
jgi:hypothetical protein